MCLSEFTLASEMERLEILLAELLIVLHAASHALNRLFHGDSFDEATSYAGNLDAMRALARAADAAHKQVEQRIKFAAETEVGARK